MGILRDINVDAIEPIVEIVVSSGLHTIEITMNTPEATKLIKRTTELAKNQLIIGAGTVLTMADLHSAIEAGATFVVLPTVIPEVVNHCTKNGIPVFPGALTPQEIYNAWSADATMVKVFPSSFFGPTYFKEIKGPFRDVELLACGGVTPGNIGEFFSCGASAVAFGGSVFKKEWIAAREFSRIKESIRAMINGYRNQYPLTNDSNSSPKHKQETLHE